MRLPRLVALLLPMVCLLPAGGELVRAQSLFDPARHMRVAEVKSGMKGYGLTVFQGTQIERFDVEVIEVLHNFNPKYDVILIRCLGDRLKHTGAIAGMSGSPIYLIDSSGRERLAGAFAYGWSLMKDPLAGVQPIEYMLEVGSTLRPEPAATQQSGPFRAESGQPSRQTSGAAPLCRYDPLNPPLKLAGFGGAGHGNTAASALTGGQVVPQLQPLATPLMTAGLSPRLMEQFAPLFGQFGLVPLQAGGGISGGSNAPGTQPAAELVPGAVLAAPLLTGDVELTAIGTCTDVIGERVFGFGHPFNNEGPITLPMGSGKINAVITSIAQSFKLGAMTALRGTLIADQAVGVAGRLGKSPATIPIDLRVVYADGTMDVSYHFDCAAHPRLTPLLSGVAIAATLAGRRDLPQYHTVDYDLRLEFANDQVVEVKNVAVNSAAAMIFFGVTGPVVFACENPFERVMLRKLTGTIRVTPEAHQADILSVMLPKKRYRPGEVVKGFVRYRPFRAGEAILPIELPLPHDLRDGTYQLSVADQQTYLQQEQMTRPFRFTAESIDDVFAVLKDVSSVRQDALYVRLLRQADGVAVGRAAMPLLPGSRRQVLLDAGRSNVTPFVSSVVKVIPTQTVMNGSADFEITIEAEQKVEVGGQPKASPAKPEKPESPAPAENRPRQPSKPAAEAGEDATQ
ncbi:hypothetical protein [Fontivita pretiosa]|uniref:hypothetical protein n=1 Tax=Fontivita pretiosa TaxID=2989684 RepID=UPI003D1630C1